jgi:gentisate 1,2-dioxygenase
MSLPPVVAGLSASKIQMETSESNPTIWAGVCRVDDVCPPHDHDYMEIAVVLAGQGRHLSPQGEQPLRAGDVIYYGPEPGIHSTIVMSSMSSIARSKPNCCIANSRA